MAIVKTYSISADITGQAVNQMKLHKEIAATAYVAGFDGCNINGDVLDILGTTLDDEPNLDALILAHTIIGPKDHMWKTPGINLGDGATSNVLLFRSIGGGIQYFFAGVVFGEWSSNIVLRNNGVDYDGSDLTFTVVYQIRLAGSGSDDIDWVLEYQFLDTDDNSDAQGTTITETVDVSSRVDGHIYKDTFSTKLIGVEGKTLVGLSLARDGVADVYNAEALVLGFELERA